MNSYYNANIMLVVSSMAIMLCSLAFTPSIDSKTRKMTIQLFVIIIIASICEWSGIALNGKSSNLIALHVIVKAIELSVAPFVAVLCGKSLGYCKLEKPITYLSILNSVLEVISAFTGFIYYVDRQNIYHHGTFYWIYIAVYFIDILYFFVQGVACSNRYQHSGGYIMLLITVFLIGGILVQLFTTTNITWLVVAISAVMFYKFYGDIIQHVDGLTELINRWGYENYISRFHGKGAVLFFDVNDFKYINDTYGHDYGDTCLKTVANCLRSAFSPYGKCFRVGGDEFCVIVEKKPENAKSYLLIFEGRMRECRRKDPHLPRIAVGIVHFDTAKMNINDAVKSADSKMYRNKNEAKSAEAAVYR